MRPAGYPHPVRRPASVGPPPVRGTDQGAVTRMERLRRSRSAGRVVLALASLALAGLIALALSGVGFAGIGRSLERVHPGWLVAALALNGLSMLLRAVSWEAVLRAALPDVRIRSLVVVRATMIGVLVSAVVPGRVGEPARAYLVARRAGDTARRFPLILGTVFAQTLINLIAMAILAAITIASLAILRGHATELIAAAIVPLALLAVIVASPTLLTRASRSDHAHLSRAVRWLSDQIVQVRRGLRVFTKLRLGAAAIVTQLAAWAVQTLAAYAILHALDLQGKAGLAAAAAILLAVNLTALVPVTPSNIGIFQATTIAVLAAYGIDAGPALAYGILLQAVEIATAILLGVPALFGERISLNDIRRFATATPTPPHESDSTIRATSTATGRG
jgi:phosphatidyl-myo-inositol alpha-mannosyltransferase